MGYEKPIHEPLGNGHVVSVVFSELKPVSHGHSSVSFFPSGCCIEGFPGVTILLFQVAQEPFEAVRVPAEVGRTAIMGSQHISAWLLVNVGLAGRIQMASSGVPLSRNESGCYWITFEEALRSRNEKKSFAVAKELDEMSAVYNLISDLEAPRGGLQLKKHVLEIVRAPAVSVSGFGDKDPRRAVVPLAAVDIPSSTIGGGAGKASKGPGTTSIDAAVPGAVLALSLCHSTPLARLLSVWPSQKSCIDDKYTCLVHP
ncbi:hypothetical protein P691DRAFT_790620 [Macrolepiota fuliginosa MF-IS2]|uniref:Uncharacterized protein n=1 Tax=Macrolepiota fuliginosa MF-IS2 TaxID=1400762 RepID=A0A9P5X1N2_9AGAR|nr:hypothetical protein P691DRAFT_790620 [Macrolepiota fuliginosa MF-IS2]